MSYNIVCGSRILSIISLFIKRKPSIKLPISKKFKVRNKTFVLIGRDKSNEAKCLVRQVPRLQK